MVTKPEGGTLFSGTENSTIQCSWGRGGVPCPGAENAHERKGRVQSSGTEDVGAMCCVYGNEWSLVLLVWKRGSHKGSLWEWVGPVFPGAEDLETVQCLCRIP